MSTLYKLVANTFAFNGTDCESSHEKIDLCISPDRSKLEEVLRYLEGSEYEKLRKEREQDYKRSWQERKDNPLPKSVVFKASFGDVTLPILTDNYYGSGTVSHYSIDSVPWLDPSTFL